MADTRDTIRTDIIINAKASIQTLRDMAAGASNNQDAIAKFSAFLIKNSRQWNIPLQELLKTYRQLNAEISKSKRESLFNAGRGSNILGGAEGYLNAALAADRFKLSSDGVVQSIRNVKGQMDVADKSIKGVGDSMEKSTKSARGFGHGIDIIRTSLGTLLAVGIFQFLNALTGAFRGFIDNLRETELAIYNLVNAERRLSEQGIEVDPKGLQDIIDSVRELVPVLSQIEAEELVSRIATNVAPALKLTEEQIRQMAEATALLFVRNKALGKSFEEVESQITNAFLTGKVSVGINNLGVKINDQIVKDEALRLGLVKTAEEFDNLTGEMESQIKASAMLSIIYRNATGDIQSLGSYMETTDAKVSRLSTVWSDFLTQLGVAFGPLIGKFLEMLINALEITIKLLEAVKTPLQTIVATITALIAASKNFGNVLDILRNPLRAIDFAQRFKEEFNKVMDSFAEFEDAADTPTAALDDLQNAADSLDMSKAQEELQDLLKDLEKLGERIEREERDFQTKLERFDADALTDRLRLIEDYNLNVAQTIRQFALRRQELEDKYRQNELNDEAKFQEQLRQLREKFLFNLEDALRERDARQTLRLIDQYKMDKEAMINEHALQQQQAAQNHQEALNDLKEQEAERLRVMAEEHALRLQRQEEDSALRRERMLADHAQEIADLQAQKESILREAADRIAKEYDLDAQGAQAIYELLNKYYGSDGILQKLVAEGYNGMLQESVGFLAQLQQVIAYQQGLMSSMALPGSMSGAPLPYWQLAANAAAAGQAGGGLGGRSLNFAKGGQFVATRPTSLNVAEGGMPELVSVIPLSKILGGALNANGSGGSNGINGSIEVAVTLSPDLEGRIIEKSMNGTAEVISRVNRSK